MSGNANRKPAFETSDARPKVVLIFTAAVALLMILAVVGIGLMLGWFRKEAVRQDKPSFFIRDERWQGPDIRLETHPSRQYQALRRAEEELLTTYGWTDPAEKRVRVPVKRAMELMLSEKIPVRKPPPSPEDPAAQPAEAQQAEKQTVTPTNSDTPPMEKEDASQPSKEPVEQ